MARFGPTVLPQPVDLASIFDRIAQGYEYGQATADRRRQRKREEQADRERQEDRNRYLASLRAADLNQPGTSTLAGFLDESHQVAATRPVELSERAQPRLRGQPLATLRESPQAEARFRKESAAGPLTPETLRRIGRAEETDIPLEFREPEPRGVRLPSGKTMMLRDRAPFLTESGVVMDPRRAREERTLAAFLEQQMLAPPAQEKPWEPRTRQEQLDFAREKAEAGRRPVEEEERLRVAGRAPKPESPPITLANALEAVARLYGTWDPDTETYQYPFGPRRRYEIAQAMVRGEPIPEPEAEPPPVAEPPEPSEPGFFTRLGRALVPGGRGWSDTAPAGTPEPPPPTARPDRAAVPPEPTVRRRAPAPAGRSLPESMSRDALMMVLTPEQQEKYNQLTDQGRSHEDAVDELAADDWDALVEGGMDPDEATRTVARRYGLTGGR